MVALGGWFGFRNQETHLQYRYVRFSQRYGFLDTVYRYFLIDPVLKLSTLLNRTDQRVIDRAVNGIGVSTVVLAHLTNTFDRLGVDGLVKGTVWLVGRVGKVLRSVQNGLIQSYITAAVVALLLMLWWLL